MSHDWGYTPENGPETWGSWCLLADEGKRQSPIDIETNKSMFDHEIIPLSHDYCQLTEGKLKNNAHTVQYCGIGDAFLSGGPLSHTYKFAQFHFHWGENDNEGSEHHVDGKKYPVEIHMVHYNSDLYDNIGAARDCKDGLSVLGFFVEVGENDNEALKPIFDQLRRVSNDPTKKGDAVDTVDIPNGVDINAMLPCTAEFWTYPGSLTTPPLSETVTWIVLKNTITISQAQMDMLRAVRNSHRDFMSRNFRPPCPLHDREVRTTFMSHNWGYGHENGPLTWSNLFSLAKHGKRQSPIDIQTNNPEVVEFHGNMDPLSYNYAQLTEGKLRNNGHSVTYSTNGNAFLRDGPLSHEYKFAQFHFHWGKNDNEGSEHRLNGKMFPAEIHMVHYNSDLYDDIKAAMGSTDGLCVLGFFVEVDDDENKALKPIFDQLHKVITKGDTVDIPDGVEVNAMLPSTAEFWTYPGSLTTPPLFETVTWIVLKNTITVSHSQLNELRKLEGTHGHKISGNYRPPCDLCGRHVRASFQGKSDTTKSDTQGQSTKTNSYHCDVV